MYLYILTCCVILSLCKAQTTSTENCVTPNGEEAQCLSVYSCAPFLTVGTKPSNETLEFLKQSQCGQLKVCCGSSITFTNESTTTTAVPPTTRRNNWRPIAPRERCGLQQVDDRIYKENVTAVDEFPWIVLLGFISSVDNKFGQLCTGTLISRRYVLTSAFCAGYKKNFGFDLIARLGEYDRGNETDCADNPHFPECTDGITDYEIEAYVRHPNFFSPFRDDVGLLRLAKNVPFSDFVRPICLPIAGIRNATTGDNVVYSGWGYGFKNATFVEAQEKKRTVNKIVSHEECLELWKSSRYVRNSLNRKVYCAVELENNIKNPTCDGDRGGPAMIKLDSNQWQQDGIISHENCESGKIITRLSEHMNWILENITP